MYKVHEGSFLHVSHADMCFVSLWITSIQVKYERTVDTALQIVHHVCTGQLQPMQLFWKETDARQTGNTTRVKLQPLSTSK